MWYKSVLVAVQRGDSVILDELLVNVDKEQMNYLNHSLDIPFNQAVYRGHYDIAQKLLKSCRHI